jgi:hypothetical protein
MLKEDVPDRIEVSSEASRVIELLKKSLVRYMEAEPIDIQLGDREEVKGPNDEESLEII